MVKDHRGDTFVSELEMRNSWGIDYRLFRERRRRGWNLRQSLSTPFYEGTTVFDHLGNAFESEAEMCEAYGISHYTYTARMMEPKGSAYDRTLQTGRHSRTRMKCASSGGSNTKCSTTGI